MRKRPSQRRLVPLSVKWYHDNLKQYTNRYFFLSMSIPIYLPDQLISGCPPDIRRMSAEVRRIDRRRTSGGTGRDLGTERDMGTGHQGL